MYQQPHPRRPDALPKPYRFARLPLVLDPAPLLREIDAAGLPWVPSLWKWHRGTDFCVLRGGREGPRPGDRLVTGAGVDAPALAQLPTLRALLDGAFGAPAAVAWIGRSPPGATIRLHVDNTRHWDDHHRVHVPLRTDPRARLCVDGHFLHLSPGTAWLINNSRPHGALNDGPARLHLVLDLPPAPAVEALLAGAVAVAGDLDPPALARLARDPLADLTPDELADADLMHRWHRQ